MCWDDGRFIFGHGTVMLLIVLVLWVGLVAVTALTAGWIFRLTAQGTSHEDTARRILAEQFARGELDEQEYRNRLAILLSDNC